MIPVALAKEPESFDEKVRQKGLGAIDELVGRTPKKSRPGPRRSKIANTVDEIPSDKFPPFWRDALGEMLESYQRICAFLAIYLPPAIGNPSVDHMLPKSAKWNKVYEWDNYRLCAASVNARKKDMGGLVDPFECKAGWFALEWVGFQVIPGPQAPDDLAAEIQATATLLNAPDCLRLREEYVSVYQNGEITLSYLESHAPFVASELRRQGRMRPGDR
jgi:hypothetical protein